MLIEVLLDVAAILTMLGICVLFLAVIVDITITLWALRRAGGERADD